MKDLIYEKCYVLKVLFLLEDRPICSIQLLDCIMIYFTSICRRKFINLALHDIRNTPSLAFK